MHCTTLTYVYYSPPHTCHRAHCTIHSTPRTTTTTHTTITRSVPPPTHTSIIFPTTHTSTPHVLHHPLTRQQYSPYHHNHTHNHNTLCTTTHSHIHHRAHYTTHSHIHSTPHTASITHTTITHTVQPIRTFTIFPVITITHTPSSRTHLRHTGVTTTHTRHHLVTQPQFFDHQPSHTHHHQHAHTTVTHMNPHSESTSGPSPTLLPLYNRLPHSSARRRHRARPLRALDP